MKGNNYNGIARFYDFLKKLVFGDKLLRNEVSLLNKAEHGSSLLVAGCGTAGFLDLLDSEKIDSILCIDSSREMIKLAQKRAHRTGFESKIQFVCIDFLKWSETRRFSCISLPYFLDGLTNEDIQKTMDKCFHLLEKDGQLIISDFSAPEGHSLFYRFLINIQYLFFYLFTGIQRSQIPDYQSFIDNEKWELVEVSANLKGHLFSMSLKKRV